MKTDMKILRERRLFPEQKKSMVSEGEKRTMMTGSREVIKNEYINLLRFKNYYFERVVSFQKCNVSKMQRFKNKTPLDIRIIILRGSCLFRSNVSKMQRFKKKKTSFRYNNG